MNVVARDWRGADEPTAVEVTVPIAEEPVVYIGLVTRALAFGIDAAVLNAVAIVVAALFGLMFSIFALPSWLKTAAIAVGGVAYVLWIVGYFVTFWVTTGQTPGSRVLRIRVVPAEGGRLVPRRALVRYAGLILAALPLFAGYLLILVTNRRQGLQDILARTVVVEAPPEEPPANGRRRPVPPDGA